MAAFQIAKTFAICWSISYISPAIAGVPAGYSKEGASSADIASHILQGLGSLPSTPSPTNASPAVTASVPQANISWGSKFSKADISHAQSCWSAYTNWFASYPGYYASANISLSSTSLSQNSTYVFPASSTAWPTGNVSTYKLCDGTPRAAYSPSTTNFDSSVIYEGETCSTAYPTSVPNQPCTLNQEDCAIMYFGTNLNNLDSDDYGNEWAQDRLYAACGMPLDLEVPCLVQGGPVELMYFPVTTTGGDLGGCLEGTTITPAEEPQPVTTLGTTFQPGKAYISFETLYAAYRSLSAPGGAAVQLGPGYSNKIFEFHSDEISTNCYASVFSKEGIHNPGYGPGTQLNFADLNFPPPATAYACQNQCQSVSYELGPQGENVTTHTISPNPCSTIFDNFNPLIAVPTRLRDMHPEWASCRFWNHRQANIVFDPPIALTKAAVAAKPTLPSGYDTAQSAAMPASTGMRPASQTATAVADSTPTVTEDAGQHVSEVQKSSATRSSVVESTAVPFTPVQNPDGTTKEAAIVSGAQVLTAGDATITAVYVSGATNAVQVQGSTLSVGGPAATVDGATVSMGTYGLVAIHASTTSSSRATTAGSSQAESSSSAAAPTTSGSRLLTANYGLLASLVCLILLVP